MSPVFRSIRWRVQAWHGLILVLVLAGFGMAAYQVAWDNQVRRIDRELEIQLSMVFRPAPEPPGSPGSRGPRGERHDPGPPPVWKGPEPSTDRRRHERPEPGRPPFFTRARAKEMVARAAALSSGAPNPVYLVAWDDAGGLLARSPNAPETVPLPNRAAPGAAKTPSNILTNPGLGGGGILPADLPGARTRGEFREVYRFMPFGDCFLAGRSIAPDLKGMRRLALLLATAGGAVLVLGLAGGWWIATRAIRPINEISATAVKIAAGDLSQRINAADAESELGRLAGVLNSTFSRLEAAFANQARFTSDASHELRTPVTVILSQTQMSLARERPASEYREALEACQRAAQRMRRLIGSLLELARLDAGEECLKREPFDLARVAGECLELVRPLADRGQTFKADLEPATCLGDAERIAQVVTNLLTNAIHYNRDQGEVRLATRTENGSAVLTVSDTGPGINPDDLPHIFERFYRADKARSGAGGCAGLGLAISKAIVDAHGGLIEVSSQPGAGATFAVRLRRTASKSNLEI